MPTLLGRLPDLMLWTPVGAPSTPRLLPESPWQVGLWSSLLQIHSYEVNGSIVTGSKDKKLLDDSQFLRSLRISGPTWSLAPSCLRDLMRLVLSPLRTKQQTNWRLMITMAIWWTYRSSNLSCQWFCCQSVGGFCVLNNPTMIAIQCFFSVLSTELPFSLKYDKLNSYSFTSKASTMLFVGALASWRSTLLANFPVSTQMIHLNMVAYLWSTEEWSQHEDQS